MKMEPPQRPLSKGFLSGCSQAVTVPSGDRADLLDLQHNPHPRPGSWAAPHCPRIPYQPPVGPLELCGPQGWGPRHGGRRECSLLLQTQPVFLRRKEDWFNRHPKILCHPLPGLWRIGLSLVFQPGSCGRPEPNTAPDPRPSLSFWAKAKEVLGGAVPQPLGSSLPHSSLPSPRSQPPHKNTGAPAIQVSLCLSSPPALLSPAFSPLSLLLSQGRCPGTTEDGEGSCLRAVGDPVALLVVPCSCQPCPSPWNSQWLTRPKMDEQPNGLVQEQKHTNGQTDRQTGLLPIERGRGSVPCTSRHALQPPNTFIFIPVIIR